MYINKAVLPFITTLYLTKGYPSQQASTCQPCPAGTFQSSPCKFDNGPPSCSTCDADQFTDRPNNAPYCDHCKICQRSQIIKTNCTTVNDTVCECPKGSVWQNQVDDHGHCVTISDLPSFNCQLCPAGTFQFSPCQFDNGPPSCSTCVAGQFTDRPNNALNCDHCTICQRSEIIKTNCTTITDTVCACPDGKVWQNIVGTNGHCVTSTTTDDKLDCETCPDGTFRTTSCSCQSHTQCNPNQIVVQQGTELSDTVCKEKGVTPDSSGGETKPKEKHVTHDFTEILLYVMTILLVLFVIYFCLAVLAYYFGLTKHDIIGKCSKVKRWLLRSNCLYQQVQR